MPEVTEVDLPAVDPQRFESVLSPEQVERLHHSIGAARTAFEGRTIWNVNSTAKGGGVAEMLTSLLPYARGAGVDARWLVIGGDAEFFRITKRIHNRLHGALGDGGPLGDAERSHYEEVLADQGRALIESYARPQDVVILHDPQTAGLVPLLVDPGRAVIWRCHVGLDTPNQHAREAWNFLLPYVRRARRCIFSRRAFAWEGIDDDRIRVVAPSIDPFSSKNYEMDAESVQAILGSAGLALDGHGPATYRRADGSPGRIEHRATMTEMAPLQPETPLVVQISRWDRLKDHAGVLRGFVEGVVPTCDAHLMLAGPSVAEVADDPEGAEVFAEVRDLWGSLDEERRAQVHLACLPMDDEEENAAMVNALQRRADVIVQKSLAEGFGLTVAEAMWKSRPVVASRIGGIQDQIDSSETGVLLDHPEDAAAFADAVCSLLRDRDRARRIGEAARARVQQEFLGSRHLAQYVEICTEVL